MTDIEGTTPVPDGGYGANPVGAVGVHAVSTALLLILAVQAELPPAACALFAWGGGALATVALLLARDAASLRSPPHAKRASAPGPATAPDL